MRRIRQLFFLFSFLSLSSCGYSVPEDISSFIGNMSYYSSYKNVKELTFDSKEKTFDSKEFSGTPLGEEHQVFNYKIIDEEKGTMAFQVSTSYSGNLVENGIVSKVIDASFDVSTNKYIKRTIVTDSNNKTTETKESKIKKEYEYALRMGVFGEEQYYQSGLYYGSFLQQIAKNASKFMTVSTDKTTLTYDPPATGLNQDDQTYVDMDMVVDKLGLLMSHNAKMYDDKNSKYALSNATVEYTFNEE